MPFREIRPGAGSRQATPRPEPGRTPHRYRLKFNGDGGRLAKDIEFEAEDAFEALTIAHEEAHRHSAELWRDGTRLCSINRQSGELWQIVSADDHGDPR